MKKIFLTAAITLGLVFGAIAQSDGFFSDWYDIDSRDANLPEFPENHGNSYNSDAPVGSGVLILTTLGFGYAALKRKDSEFS